MKNVDLKNETPTFGNVLLVAVFSFFKKVFTYNYCDTCGFTKDKVYVTEICTESGIIQCEKCSGL